MLRAQCNSLTECGEKEPCIHELLREQICDHGINKVFMWTMFPCSTELLEMHKVEAFPAGAGPPSVDRGQEAVGTGPKSDSWKDWLISIFAGSQAVIQRADGKLYNKEGGDWRGSKRGNFQRDEPRITEGFVQTVRLDAFVLGWGHGRTCRARVCLLFCAQRSCERLTRVLMRGVLCSALRLFLFLSLIYCNVGICGAPIWLTHHNRIGDGT